MGFTVSIVGRPNVGKSTLFNRIVGRRQALVDDTPGVTRDFREGVAQLGPHLITLLDTAGIDQSKSGELMTGVRRVTRKAVERSDACLFLFDARSGVSSSRPRNRSHSAPDIQANRSCGQQMRGFGWCRGPAGRPRIRVGATGCDFGGAW